MEVNQLPEFHKPDTACGCYRITGQFCENCRTSEPPAPEYENPYPKQRVPEFERRQDAPTHPFSNNNGLGIVCQQVHERFTKLELELDKVRIVVMGQAINQARLTQIEAENAELKAANADLKKRMDWVWKRLERYLT